MTQSIAQVLRDFARNAFPITYFKHPPRAATWNPELCVFFEEIQASLLIDGHLRAGPERFSPRANLLTVTSDPPKRAKKPATKKTKRAARKVPA